MSKQVHMLEDKYPFGCKGDVVTLSDEAYEELSDKADANVFRLVVPAADAKSAPAEAPKADAEPAKVEDKKAEPAKEADKPAEKKAEEKPADAKSAK